MKWEYKTTRSELDNSAPAPEAGTEPPEVDNRRNRYGPERWSRVSTGRIIDLQYGAAVFRPKGRHVSQATFGWPKLISLQRLKPPVFLPGNRFALQIGSKY